jgi:hypothetical protein
MKTSKIKASAEMQKRQAERRAANQEYLNRLQQNTPSLKKLVEFVEMMSVEEKEELFTTFDSHEFLAYDLFGSILEKARQ